MKYLILGGTGTLGRAVAKALLDKNPHNIITIFSRGEFEQQRMKAEFPDFRYVIGDVKSRAPLSAEIMEHDVVFHFAALKHIDVCQENPGQAVENNIQATRNVASLCKAFRKRLVFSSTDKAVLPINFYGYTKAMCEGILLTEYPNISTIFRWGNVVGSRGSVIPMFAKAIERGEAIKLTDERMTRFWIRIEDAAKFVIDNIWNGGKVLIPPEMKAASILRVVGSIQCILNKIPGSPYPCEIIGIRQGEKLHECLFTSHEYCLNSNDEDGQYTDEELTDLLSECVYEVLSD